jgi:type IV fimbrial biogenesis protein FimT
MTRAVPISQEQWFYFLVVFTPFYVFMATVSAMNKLFTPELPPSYCRCRGFTLLELMVAVTAMLVLLLVAAPSMSAMMNSVKLTSASNDLLAHIYLARSEAIKRRGRVVLCKSADGASCASSGGWEQGWIVFHDTNNNGVLDAGELVIARQDPLPLALKVTGNQNVARYVSFDPTGATKTTGGGFQAGTLTFCRQSVASNEARQIILNAVGRPRVQRFQIASCV